MYELLPDFYRLLDAERGEPLKKFLEPMQAVLDAIYADEKILRTLQDPRATPAEFLKWIALSLGWEFITQDVEAQRNEALEIVNFYDLKGTPYAMRLLAALTLSPWFVRLSEYYDGGPGSISTIRRSWALAPENLKAALAGAGKFGDAEWLAERIAERGRPYDFSPSNRLYHYFVEVLVSPGSFARGELRKGVLGFIEKYRQFHPAGRFAYIYIRAPSGVVPDHGAAVIEELCGGIYLDLGWQYDTERIFDAPHDPVHPSTSWYFPRILNTFDKGTVLDDGWTWDMGDMDAHILIELN